MAFSAQALLDTIQSHALTLGLFEQVNTHEPKAAPANGPWCSIWVQSIAPLGGASGLAITSGRVELRARIGTKMLAKPEDAIDPNILSAVSVLIGEYSGAFTLGGTARNIDLLGQYGTPLSAVAGYVTIDGSMYRVMDVTIPVIINDLWVQSG
jgi:hypothetical protein